MARSTGSHIRRQRAPARGGAAAPYAAAAGGGRCGPLSPREAGRRTTCCAEGTSGGHAAKLPDMVPRPRPCPSKAGRSSPRPLRAGERVARRGLLRPTRAAPAGIKQRSAPLDWRSGARLYKWGPAGDAMSPGDGPVHGSQSSTLPPPQVRIDA
eukprot:CAMPEP_0176237886 /NCGR_PEP_ID=MMETSP0121_2-20121125/28079_1 /TAXON_ID=160619 /ORGANISM="Kryptoperidinium foliaceum, Strain CCMP 1326" /LENGTH=153 /DNA_ID=CAMNT_0017577341 /DNA_START=119 /DNA_END=579 /DNA_ORIENTATION=+